MKFWTIPILGALLCFALAGCGRGDSTGRTAEEEAEAERARIRALPYVGSSPSSDPRGGVVRREPERSSPGYSLVTIQVQSAAELIDEAGRVVHRWQLAGSDRWVRSVLLPDGGLLAIGADPSLLPDGRPSPVMVDEKRYVARLDVDGAVLWKRAMTAHHDIAPAPDGKYVALLFQRRMVPALNPDVPLREDLIARIAPDGSLIDDLSLYEATSGRDAVFPLHPGQVNRQGGEPWLDPLHANSVQWMQDPELARLDPLFALDNLLVCFRHQDRIAMYSWSRREVVWAWGDKILEGPHDAQVLPSGNILLFDNGIFRKWSRALEMDPRTGKIVWEYRARPPGALLTMSIGSVQRLPNGNTLIAESNRGRAIEVTREGETVWEYLCPYFVPNGDRAGISRIRRYAREFIDAIPGLSR